MAVPLRISQAYRVSRGPRPIGQVVRLITDEMAEAYALRGWGRHDANRLALGIAAGVYTESEAKQEFLVILFGYAERAGIRTVDCRALARSMVEDELDAIDAKNQAALKEMTAAAEQCLIANRRDTLAAAIAAARIARANRVPPDLIDDAMRFAKWRTRPQRGA